MQSHAIHIRAFILCISLGACGANDQSYVMPDLQKLTPVQSSVRSVEVLRLDLPRYAEDSEVAIVDENGVLRSQANLFWADDPDRALTEHLAAAIDGAMTADVVAEPWPFLDPAQVQIEVRVQNLTVVPDGNLRMNGQFIVISEDLRHLQQAQRFDISVSLPSESISDLAKSRISALAELARQVTNALAA
ncbi:MAG: ABC-type transport auxiliary lipoprotein family protein [Pseudomonadota bacterium]